MKPRAGVYMHQNGLHSKLKLTQISPIIKTLGSDIINSRRSPHATVKSSIKLIYHPCGGRLAIVQLIEYVKCRQHHISLAIFGHGLYAISSASCKRFISYRTSGMFTSINSLTVDRGYSGRCLIYNL